jgi:YggT family protein
MSNRQVSQTTSSEREPGLNRRVMTFKATYVIWMILGLIEAFIGIRILLLLLAANPENPFAVFIYNVSNFFVYPFLGLTQTPSAGGMVLEIPSFIAMAVYALVFWGIERLVWVIFYRPREASVSTTEQSSSERHTL